ncbi:hypothetical protein RM549_03460 [Salegentibacter sp. F188]|uniref:Uncharacterized protein n=1 Tax=Autumnicola patrickiae TaxID=3075591 RepID=A0ABU3DYL9_9FLAO|nr:hypothetical protein [Salegentibacter sp. F188]MDT0688824.1 hypothetical protein [Salegentibacter sp. F188]
MKWIPIFPLLLLTINSLFAQTPEKISYQAVIRDNSQALVTSSDVDLKILIREGSAKGTAVYEETHYTTTNSNGLISLQIGTGIVNRGSFENINWAKGSYFIESQVDPTGSSNYSITGVSQILSVPYSLHSKTAENFSGAISEAQISDLYHYSDADINGFEAAFEGWDKDASDDFDGKYSSLTGLPDIYTKSEVIQLLSGNESPGRFTQSLNLTENELSISGGNSISFENWDRDASDDFSGNYSDLENKPDLFSGSYLDLQDVPSIYTTTQVDSLVIANTGPDGVAQSLNLDQNELSISGGNSISFEGWDTDSSDDFSGNYMDLENKPEFFSGDFYDLRNTPEIYTRNQVDSLIVTRSGSEGNLQLLSLEGNQLSITGGNTISLNELNGNFSGNYMDLQNKPEIFSGDFNDLMNTPEFFSGNFEDLLGLPQLYTKSQVDSLIVTRSGAEGAVQSLNLEGDELNISGGNSISFEGWDMDSSDDFSGDYIDLENKPEIFSGDFNDLMNTPEFFSGNFNDLTGLPQLYTKSQVDSLIVTRSGAEGSIQSLSLEGGQLSISGGNTVSLNNWGGGFSGSYLELEDRPDIYSRTEVDSLIITSNGPGGSIQSLSLEGNELKISGSNSISFEGWDMNASDDFSGDYLDLRNLPQLYSTAEIDSLLVNRSGSEGTVQSLNLEGDQLSISGGNTISLNEWNGGFSGSYLDLEDRPELFSGDFFDLMNTPEIYTRTQVDSLIVTRSGSEGAVQSLNLEGDQLSISGGNTISLNEWKGGFSGDYLDLENRPELFSGDFEDLANTPEFFTGNYEDLQGLPELYTRSQVDSLIVTRDGSEGTVQTLSLEGSELNISGGNSISLEGWDMDNSDDFSGDYFDLRNLPQLYTTAQVDSLVSANVGDGGAVQSLNLEENRLSISGGNSISFEKWDTNAADDFDGYYTSLIDAPEVYTKAEVDDLVANGGSEESADSSQFLTLNEDQLTISNGNTISFENWDRDATDDFDGNYSSLINAPKIYTQSQVDSIKADLLEEVERKYAKKAEIVDFGSSRTIKNTDIENTIVCTTSATLTITSNFNDMIVGQTINLEIHGTTLTVKGSSGVTINGNTGGSKALGNNEAYTGGILRKTGSNTYIVL